MRQHNYKNALIVSLWMLMLLLFPLLVRSHHLHKEHPAKHESHSHFQVPDETCLICNFEFSVFSDTHISQEAQSISYFEALIRHKNTYVVSIPVQYSFQHRAPPVFTN